MFEPFVTTKAGGSGLGLSIVHRAVEAHHGFILVDGAGPAGGTKVSVILPRLGSDGPKRTPRSTPKRET
jgi:signal transduction histidine kinase